MAKRIGPGPAKYQLPATYGFNPHDPRKLRLPQYSCGQRLSTKYTTIGPGPGKYELKTVNRYGLHSTPVYTLKGRLGDLTKDRIPAPCDHDVNNNGPTAPIYSMHDRTYIADRDQKPAPNAYMYSTKGYKPRAPVYSLSSRIPEIDYTNSPGPAKYGGLNQNVTNRKAPLYSMKPKIPPIGNRTNIPGPNRYDLNKYSPGNAPPNYTFGIRHSEYAPPMIVQCDN